MTRAWPMKTLRPRQAEPGRLRLPESTSGLLTAPDLEHHLLHLVMAGRVTIPAFQVQDGDKANTKRRPGAAHPSDTEVTGHLIGFIVSMGQLRVNA
jgi:hypothetical protein